MLNGRRAAVLRFDEPSQRFEIKVEIVCDPDEVNITKSVKESNLTLEPRLPLTDKNCKERGIVTSVGDESSRTLAQLLLWFRGSYRVPDTVLRGYAGMAFYRMGEMNFMFFVSC